MCNDHPGAVQPCVTALGTLSPSMAEILLEDTHLVLEGELGWQRDYCASEGPTLKAGYQALEGRDRRILGTHWPVSSV